MKTSFKKNHAPTNHKDVGYERITRDGYIERKIAEPNVFVLLHRLIWQEQNGPIPQGFNIQFKDGNKLNVNIENLYMISRSDQLKNQNSFYSKYPKEIQMAIHAKAILSRQINKLQNKEANNE